MLFRSGRENARANPSPRRAHTTLFWPLPGCNSRPQRVAPPDPRPWGRESRPELKFSGRESLLRQEMFKSAPGSGAWVGSWLGDFREILSELPTRGRNLGSGVEPGSVQNKVVCARRGLGFARAFSRPNAPVWYCKRYAVANASANPSPHPHCVSLRHSRPDLAAEIVHERTPDPRKSISCLESRPKDLGSGGETRLEG